MLAPYAPALRITSKSPSSQARVRSLAEEVAGFANRADDVGGQRRDVFWFHRFDMVIGVIQGGTHEVVHGGIDHDEVFLFAVFDELDARQQRACVADQAAAGFEDQFHDDVYRSVFEPLGPYAPKSGTVSS